MTEPAQEPAQEPTQDPVTGTPPQSQSAAPVEPAGLTAARPPRPTYISRRRFEELVADAMEEIPEPLWNFIDNVVITVEEWPACRVTLEERLRAAL